MLSKIVEYDDYNEHIVVTLLDFPRHYEIDKGHIISLNKKNNTFNKFLIIFTLIKIIKNQKPDIIQTWMKANFYVIFIKFFSNAKIISNFRNGYIGKNNKLFIKIYNLILKLFDGHIFVSQSALKEREKIGLEFSEYQVINNGFSLPKYPIKQIDNCLVFGHMGRFHPVKNQKMIIEAFKIFSKNKNVKLILAGAGLNYENLNLNDIDQEKLSVLGEIKDISKFYEKLDVFILTSLSEGFPNVIGEAMSYAIPVISTDAGESYSIIEETGFKVRSVDDLVKVMNYIYNNINILECKSENARKRIEKYYTITKTVEDYKKYYKEIGERI